MDKTTQWIDSLKIHLLHPHKTTRDINQWLLGKKQPCAIEKYRTIEICADQKGVGIPIPTKASFLIDINLISTPETSDLTLCWIVGDQIYSPHRNHSTYLDWLPNDIIALQKSPYLGVTRITPSTQPITVTVSYKELYLPNHLSQNLTHIPIFHTILIGGQLQSCWRCDNFCPDPSDLEYCPKPKTLSTSIYLISEPIVESEDEFIRI